MLRYKHKKNGLEIRLEPAGFATDFSFFNIDLNDLSNKLDSSPRLKSFKPDMLTLYHHIRQNYEPVSPPSGDSLNFAMHELIRRLPEGSKLILILDDVRYRDGENSLKIAHWVGRYNDTITSICDAYPFVYVLKSGDFIKSEDEIQVGGNHYDRMVYFRIAQQAIAAVQAMPAKTA